ncbi:hypothetical protein [Legionella rowbothamii]|uniref:hypothetical protein n=1 Tax=Legionella rowbothamii TaxID=96229 RepID=UPI0010542E41|nr:hypothetical protein [Legionella rowbothamii]
MNYLTFKNYDRDFVRAYFEHKSTLYCVQPGFHYLPELLVCSHEGEPSHQVTDAVNYSFTNMPPDGDSWDWSDVCAFFQCKEITSNGQLISRMNDLFEVRE